MISPRTPKSASTPSSGGYVLPALELLAAPKSEGRGQALERGQHVAAARFSRGTDRRLRLARRARRLVFLLLLLLVGLELRLQRGAGAVVEARLAAARRRRRVTAAGAPAQPAGEPGLEAEEAVGDPA